MNVGLVLEGGGMRGIFTAGVLDLFMDKGLYIPYVAGVSAGACYGMSYVSRQRGRSINIVEDYLGDHRYLSLRNFFKERSFFGMKFVFEEIANNLNPFDFDTYNLHNDKFYVGVTDCVTGNVFYPRKEEVQDIITLVKASCSIPLISPYINIGERMYADGGTADPIPIHKSISDGNEKHIVVLTQNDSYIKKRDFISAKFVKHMNPEFSGLAHTLNTRHETYNDSINLVHELEKKKQVVAIRPEKPLAVGRVDKNLKRIIDLYVEGYEIAARKFGEIEALIGTVDKG